MKRLVAWTSVGVMMLTMWVWTLDAWARAGGGSAAGSRGSRSSSAPARPGLNPASPNRQPAHPAGAQQAMPQRSGWMSGLTGGIMGFALGGLIGSLLFGGLGSGLFGGIGLLEILLIGGLLYFVFVYMRRRQQPVPASPYGYAPPQGAETPSWQSTSMYAATAPMAVTESDLERGLRYIRQMDSAFDPVRFTDTASDVFLQVQAAWMGRDMGAVRPLMTPEMYEQMHTECERLRVNQHINRLENMAIRSTEVSEAWQESGQDFVTVRFLASLLDYTIEERSNQLVAGSRTAPVQVEEYWTFVRPAGPHPWQLSAIQQAG